MQELGGKPLSTRMGKPQVFPQLKAGYRLDPKCWLPFNPINNSFRLHHETHGNQKISDSPSPSFHYLTSFPFSPNSYILVLVQLPSQYTVQVEQERIHITESLLLHLTHFTLRLYITVPLLRTPATGAIPGIA